MLSGIVLCGGQSRRMGRSKIWLPFGPEFLLQRVVRILGEVASPVVVAAAPGQPLPPLPSETVIVRDPIANLGPLQGLTTGLKALSGEVEFVYLTATDAPFLQTTWVERLLDLIGDADLALPVVEGFLQPLAALYRRATVLPVAESLIQEGRRRLIDLADRVSTVRVESSTMLDVDPTLATIRNLNSIGDYTQAIRESAIGNPEEGLSSLPRGSGA